MIIGREEMLPRVAAVEACSDYHLLLTFRNGEKRCYDATPLFSLPAYKNLKNVFFQVQAAYGTAIWPGDLDISPDTLYLKSVPVN